MDTKLSVLAIVVLVCGYLVEGLPLSVDKGPHETLQFTQGKVFLLGGAMDDSTASIYHAMVAATNVSSPKIAVAISASVSLRAGLDVYYNDEPGSWSYERLFRTYGMEPSVLLLARDNYLEGNTNQTEIGRANIQLVEEADIIFFNGGDQSRHTRSFFNDDGSDSDIMVVLRRKFAEGAVVAGTSAGTAVMSDPLFGTGWSYGYYYFNADLKPCNVGEELEDDRDGTDSFRYDANGALMKGFGFVENALTDSHFDARGRFGRLAAALKSANMTYGFGVEEDTALYLDHNMAAVYGTGGAWFMDSSQAFYLTDDHFGVLNVTISYLTEGDTLSLTTKEVSSTKALITNGNGKAHESKDVFSRQEGIRSIKSLVRSASTESVGYSEESNPTAVVVFHNGRGVTAYNTGQLYTIDKLVMDIGTRG